MLEITLLIKFSTMTEVQNTNNLLEIISFIISDSSHFAFFSFQPSNAY